MNPPVAEKLRAIVSQGNWERAAGMLQRVEPWLAADTLMSLPFEDQQILLVNAIIVRMTPSARIQFIDELPQAAWERLVTRLHERRSGSMAVPAALHAAPCRAKMTFAFGS